VLTFGGLATLSGTATAASPPVVTAVSPDAGLTTGGTTVTVTGSNFTGATAVHFGSDPATSLTVNSATSITATSPAESAGTVYVTVTTPNGTSGTEPTDQFTFVAAGPAPTVTGASPDAGFTSGDTTVTVTGIGFIGVTTVDFGTAAATSITVNSATSITAVSPSTSAGTTDVTVTTPNGTSTKNSTDQFTFVASGPGPAVTGVSPASGSSNGGTTVTITGTGFTGVTAVDFGSVPAAYSVTSATSISAVSPAGAGTVDVTVTTPNGLSATSSADQFTYLAAPAPPTVTALSPNSGLPTGGTTVAISGTGFTGAVAVDFGSLPASFTVNSDNAISAVSPSASPSTVNVTVTTPNGLSATGAADEFTFVASGPAPSVTKVSPSSGPSTGGTSVAVTGTGFTGASAVDFGTTLATSYTVNSATSITAVSPPGSPGKLDVTVTTPNGTSPNAIADQFTYTVVPPAVIGVSPDSGPTGGGTAVTITGTDLSGATAVAFGSTPATSFTVNSSSSISATSPPESAAVVDVTVTTSAGTSTTSAADQFTFGSPPPPGPSVAALSPTSGLTTGGTSVTITGSGFTGTTAVDFGTVSALFQVESDSTISAIAPAQLAAGRVDVTVTAAGGKSPVAKADRFVYMTPPPLPTVNRIAPATGSVVGGTTMTIFGKGFKGATAVHIGTVPVPFVVVSNRSITATSPAGKAGIVHVTVTTPDGTSATSISDEFTFDTPAPVVTGMTPTSGSTLGGTEVTITGTNFSGAFAVDFGTVPATIVVKSDSSISITATTPAEKAGKVSVTVTTPFGTSAPKRTQRFTFTAPAGSSRHGHRR